MTVQISPTAMAPQPLTKPAHGVIPTRPQIMPFTPPRKVGFFALLRPGVHRHPGHDTHRSGEVGVDHGRSRIGTGVVRVTTVEAVPAQPQDAGADGRHHQVVR